MSEGYMALIISIFRCVTPEIAFKILSGDNKHRKKRKWTAYDIECIRDLRSKGITWKQIGSEYGVTATTAHRMFQYHTKKN